jgi:fructose-1,6-bisphosphatase
MFTFEILQGDVYDVQGEYLVVNQVRANKVGDEVRHYVRYIFQNKIYNRPSDEFVAYIDAGMEDGSVMCVNRPNDFRQF